ncbi:MAG TPA: TetR/AcrR family transcriptional regulator [Streptosporangiaceae bacterium]|jgi:TetR/AcrR family transcriptional repressor of nem operon|nr:TetR/AcrR family transcriptional regulator [Streptosporangiaceae bacterium]
MTAGTPARILDIAERLVQVRGFNGFSYADVATELQITTAALHYHFTGKPQLGLALVDRYAARFGAALAGLDARCPTAPDKLRGYVGLYLDVLVKGRMCLCGMLAAEYHTLPVPMRDSVLRFFDQNEQWLEGVLEQGAAEGSLRFSAAPREAARLILASLEGALLVARSFEDPARFESAAAGLLAGLTETDPSD